jgi:hypothetical protein
MESDCIDRHDSVVLKITRSSASVDAEEGENPDRDGHKLRDDCGPHRTATAESYLSMSVL